jgi:osmotically-inducible protein OsmY
MPNFRTRSFRNGGPYALILAGLLGNIDSGAAQTPADTANEAGKPRSTEVVVTARKQLADEEVTRRVLNALTDDPYVYAQHITITTNNGVVRLEGVVGDAGELLRVLRLCRKASGSKRMIDNLEINAQLPDGG